MRASRSALRCRPAVAVVAAMAFLGAVLAAASTAQQSGAACTPVDVVLLFDVTGSMADAIAAAQAMASDLVEGVHDVAPQSRFGVGHYWDYRETVRPRPDPSNPPLTPMEVLPFQVASPLSREARDTQAAVDSTSTAGNTGIGDYGNTPNEALLSALWATTESFSWAPGARPWIVAFTDASFHDKSTDGLTDPGPDYTVGTGDDVLRSVAIGAIGSIDGRLLVVQFWRPENGAYSDLAAQQLGRLAVDSGGMRKSGTSDLLQTVLPVLREAACAPEGGGASTPGMGGCPAQNCPDGGGNGAGQGVAQPVPWLLHTEGPATWHTGRPASLASIEAWLAKHEGLGEDSARLPVAPCASGVPVEVMGLWGPVAGWRPVDVCRHA